MKNLAFALVGVLFFGMAYVSYKVHQQNTEDLRAKELIASLMCDPTLTQKVHQAYHRKNAEVVDPLRWMEWQRRSVWNWAVKRTSRKMLKEHVRTEILKQIFGAKKATFQTLATEVAALAKKQCQLTPDTPHKKFQVAMVWEVIASYAGTPSPIKCLRCQLPKPARIAMLGPQLKDPPSLVDGVSGLISRRRTTLSLHQRSQAITSARALVQKRGWLLKKLAYQQKGSQSKARHLIAHFDERIKENPQDLDAKIERGQAFILAGDALSGAIELKQVILTTKLLLRRSPRRAQLYIQRAAAHAALTEYELAALQIRTALALCEQAEHFHKMPLLRALLDDYQRNQSALRRYKSL